MRINKASHPARNKFIWLILVLLLLLAIAFGLRNHFKKTKAPEEQTPEELAKTLQNNKTELSDSTLPDGFPTDLPKEDGAKILQNFNNVTLNGRKQSTRVYETKLSLDENSTIYKSYLEKSGWQLGQSIKTETLQVVSGIKGDKQITVSISKNSVTGNSTVDITLIELTGKDQ